MIPASEIKLNLNERKKSNTFYETWAWHALRTSAGGTQIHRENDRGKKDMEGEEDWHHNLPVHMERSHSKAAKMEAFHYVNKIPSAPWAHLRHSSSPDLHVRLLQLPARSCLSHAVVLITSNVIIPRGGWEMWIMSSVSGFILWEER